MRGNKEIGKCPGRRTIVANCVPLSAFKSRNFGQPNGQQKDQPTIAAVSRHSVATSRVRNCFWPALPITTPSATTSISCCSSNISSSNCSSSNCSSSSKCCIKQQRLFAAPQPANLWDAPRFWASLPRFLATKIKNRLLSALFMFDCLGAKGLRSIGTSVIGFWLGLRGTGSYIEIYYKV